MALATASAPERHAEIPAWQQLRSFLTKELKPTPGRTRAAFIRVAGVVLAMCMGYALNVPEVTAVVALAFFASSADRDECKKVALGVPPLVVMILLALTLVLNVFGTTPFVRTVSFIVIIFGSLFMLQAARQGQVFLLAAVFGKVFLELWDSGYPAWLTQELSFWIVVDLGLAGVCALLVSVLFGKPDKNSAAEFRARLAKRFELMAHILAADIPAKCNVEKLLAEAFSEQEQLWASLDAAVKKDSVIKARRRVFVDLVQVSQLLLHECVVLQMNAGEVWEQSPAVLAWSGGRCRAIAHMIRMGSLVAAPSVPTTAADGCLALHLVATIALAEDVAAGRSSLPLETAPEKKGFFRADAFTNPLYFRNAASAFAAAFACYCLISGADWSGIGTAVTTCLITSLTTVEQSRQKQSLRIAGAVVGGLLTLFVLIFVLPTGVGLAGLVVVTAIVTFIAGWIFAGGPNLNYAGVQLGLCYFLAVFGENKTPTSLTTVRDRVAGIFIGNLAMWLFYDRIRPTWTINQSRQSFAEEAESIARLVAERTSHRTSRDAVGSLGREREVFAKAHAALREMSDTTNPAFTPSTRAQQRNAPGIRYADSQLNLLFSLEFVSTTSAVLGLPGLDGAGEGRDIRATLLALAIKLRSGKAIECGSSSSAPSSQVPHARALLLKTQATFATLFGASTADYI